VKVPNVTVNLVPKVSFTTTESSCYCGIGGLRIEQSVSVYSIMIILQDTELVMKMNFINSSQKFYSLFCV